MSQEIILSTSGMSTAWYRTEFHGTLEPSKTIVDLPMVNIEPHVSDNARANQTNIVVDFTGISECDVELEAFVEYFLGGHSTQSQMKRIGLVVSLMARDFVVISALSPAPAKRSTISA